MHFSFNSLTIPTIKRLSFDVHLFSEHSGHIIPKQENVSHFHHYGEFLPRFFILPEKLRFNKSQRHQGFPAILIYTHVSRHAFGTISGIINH